MMIMLIAVICSILPVMGALCALTGMQIANARRNRIEKYRASPESHILNLRD
jgi:hypothetical protein